jgi:SnoaL-like domain
LDRSHAEHLVRTYVDGWKEYDSAKVLSTLHPACVLIEADGELFRGADRIASELDKRVAGEYGPWHISRWDITTLAVENELCFLEWRLEGRGNLEGASLVRFTDDKISSIREYCTTKPVWESGNEGAGG